MTVTHWAFDVKIKKEAVVFYMVLRLYDLTHRSLTTFYITRGFDVLPIC